jgi:hypothetical protein
MASARPDQDAELQLRLVDDAWDKLEEHWLDDIAKRFDRNQWTALHEESQSYLAALRTMMNLLEAAEAETAPLDA